MQRAHREMRENMDSIQAIITKQDRYGQEIKYKVVNFDPCDGCTKNCASCVQELNDQYSLE